MLNYKNYFLILVCAFCAMFTASNSVDAQDQFNSSFNFESSTLPYKWHTSAWNACGGECNEGRQNRDVACRDNAGNDAPSEADCSHSPRPEQMRSCDLPDCQWVMETCPSHVHHTGGGSGGGSDDGGYMGNDGNMYDDRGDAESEGGGVHSQH